MKISTKWTFCVDNNHYVVYNIHKEDKKGGRNEIKKFKSIHIDTEKGIYEINGEEAGFVTELKLEWDSENGWALTIEKEETYLAPIEKVTE